MSLNRAGFFHRGSYLQSGRRFGGVVRSPYELLPSLLKTSEKRKEEFAAAAESDKADGQLVAADASKRAVGGKVQKTVKRNSSTTELSKLKSAAKESISPGVREKKRKRESDVFDDKDLDSD